MASPQESAWIHKAAPLLSYRKGAVYYHSPCHLLCYQVDICSPGNNRVGWLLETGLGANSIPLLNSG